MVKHYCDVCNDELTNKNKLNGNKLYMSKVFKDTNDLEHKVELEVLTTLDGISNKGDFCRYCIMDILNEVRKFYLSDNGL